MTVILGILLTLAIFTFVVFLHELGHFVTARFTGMKVHEFGIGIPPKAKKLFTDKKGTEYTLNWLPIGGFVRIKGEDPGEEEAHDHDSFSHKKWWARALVLIAWVTMNFLLAFVIFFGLLLVGTTPIAPNLVSSTDYHSYFLPSLEDSVASGFLRHDGLTLSALSGSVGERAGITRADRLISLDGKDIHDIDAFRSEVSKGTPLKLVLSHSGVTREVQVTPVSGKIGVALSYANMRMNPDYKPSFSLGESLKKAAWETYTLSRFTFDMLAKTLKNLLFPSTPEDRKEASEMIAGPIGMGAGVISMVDHGVSFSFVLLIVATLSLNLGVLNILPFPALDGGRLVSTSVMSFFGLFTKKKRFLIHLERWIHSLGMIILLGASLIIAAMDILKIGG